MNRRDFLRTTAALAIAPALPVPAAAAAAPPALAVYLVEDSEEHWYAAESAEHAWRLHAATIGEEEAADVGELARITRLADDTPLDVIMLDEGYRTETRTAAEWASRGPGCVASTVW